MSKTVYRIMGVIVSLALTVGGFSRVEATSSQPKVTGATSGKPVYAYYYLWWSTQHWHDKLGSNYPYSASPLPLPSTTDADGCNAVSKYAGNHLIDVPTALWSQDTAGVIEGDIRTAKSAGINGFWLNWVGDGTTTQTTTTLTYTRRLSEAFAASNRVGGFKNWVSYKVASMQSTTFIINDLNFLYNAYKDDPAWEKINGKPVVTFTGSRKYSDADVQTISNAVRDRIFLVGDESKSTLTAARLAMFDAITYYWSSQDPWGNPQSFDQIKAMGDMVHAAGKRWYAPLAPGYNSRILNGTGSCVPRKNGDTLRALWNGNAKSNPDGWGMISWNEIGENTHIMPQQKWGNTYVSVLSSLIGSTVVDAPADLYDDANPAWAYSGAWSAAYTAAGPYNGAIHYTNAQNASASIKFTGTRFTLYFSKYTNRGDVQVWIDGTLKYTFSEYGNALTWQDTWTLPVSLTSGTHTVMFKNPNASSSTYINIDAIRISQ